MMSCVSLAAENIPVLLLLLVMSRQVTCACDPTNGPAGDVACVSISDYTGSQFVTCLANSYILEKSKGQHNCVHNESQSGYCYYQCMLEVYDRESGEVYPDCQCNQNKTVLPNSTVPASCYNPAGTDCGWFQNCLERKFGCSGGLDSYVLAFSHKLCDLAEGNPANVTQDAITWVNASRKCLQVELTPLLLPFESFTCAKISTYAYQKQAACYLNPYLSKIGLCDVTSTDFWKIFWALRNQIQGSDFVESLLGLLKTRSTTCTTGTGLRLGPYMYLLKVRLRLSYLSRRMRNTVFSDSTAIQDVESSKKVPVLLATRERLRRATSTGVWQGETSELRVYHQLANAAGQAMSKLLDWDSQKVLWFAYGSATTDTTVFEAQILVADHYAYGLPPSAWLRRPNMTQVALQAGLVLSKSDSNLVINNRVASMQWFRACSDISCQQVLQDIWRPSSSAVRCLRWVELRILISAEFMLLFLITG